jgi:autotransporter-associated beta strand protein
VLTNLSTNLQTINFGLTFQTATANINTASNSVILNGIIAGTNITKLGAATLFLNGANTYTGIVTNNAGAIRVGNNSGLGTTNSGTVIVSGAALELTTNNAGGNLSTGAESLSLAGTGISSGGALRNITGSNTYGGLITLTNATRINADDGTLLLTNTGTITGATFGLTFGGAGNIAVASIISNTSGTLTKDGSGTLSLTASNRFTGGTTINAGTIAISNNGAFASNRVTFASNGTTVAALANLQVTNNYNLAADGTMDVGAFILTNTGIISNTGSLTKEGAGTMVLSGLNTYGGTTTVAGGTLQVTNLANAGANSAIGTNDTIILTNGGVFSYAGASNSAMNRTIDLAGNGGFGVSNSTVAVTHSGVITNTGDFTKSGAGTLVLSASNSFSGTTTVSAGVLSLANTNALSASTLDHSSAGSVSFSNLTGANLGGLQGSTNLALTNASGTAVALNVGGNNSSTTYSGALSGGGSLIKVGTGTLALSGNSSFTGTTTISNGAVRVSHANGLGATNGGTTVRVGAALEIDGGIAIGAEALTLSNNGISSSGSLRSISGSNSYGGLISLGTGVAVGVDAGTLTLTGGVTNGNGSSFTKVGAGTLVLNSTSTATGIVTISGGTMQLGANGAIGAVALNVTNGTTFDLNGRNATLGAPGNQNVYLTGATLKSGAGTISLTTTNVGVTVHSAANANSSEISGNLNLGGNTNRFNVADGAAAEDLVISAAVSNGGILKTNTGVLVLSAANTYAGGTTINAGTVAISNGSSFGSGTVTFRSNNTTVAALASMEVTNTYVLTGNGTMDVGANILTNSGVVSGAGSLAKAGTGTLILSASNNYTGGTTVAAGRLVVDGSIASSAVSVQNGGTLGGSGAVGSTTIESGGTISPGNSPGNLTVEGNLVWNGGGNYNWQVLGTTNTAGFAAGTTWDLLTVTGTLDLTALSAGSKFNINLWSLASTGPDIDGDISDFDSSTSYEWLAVVASNITNFDASYFEVNPVATNGTAGFANALDPAGSFSVRQDGGNLYVAYEVVPEPSTYALLALAAAGLSAHLLRRRKRAKVS